MVPKNDIIFPKQWYLERIREDWNSFRKGQREKEQLSPTMGWYANQEVSTLPKGVERDQWRPRHIDYNQQTPVQNLETDDRQNSTVFYINGDLNPCN